MYTKQQRHLLQESLLEIGDRNCDDIEEGDCEEDCSDNESDYDNFLFPNPHGAAAANTTATTTTNTHNREIPASISAPSRSSVPPASSSSSVFFRMFFSSSTSAAAVPRGEVATDATSIPASNSTNNERQHQLQVQPAAPVSSFDLEAGTGGPGAAAAAPLSQTLEGTLYCRTIKRKGFRKRYVSLILANGGSLIIFKDTPSDAVSSEIGSALKVHQLPGMGIAEDAATAATAMAARAASIVVRGVTSKLQNEKARLQDARAALRSRRELAIPAHYDWTVKDIPTSKSKFFIEIPVSSDDDGDETGVNDDSYRPVGMSDAYVKTTSQSNSQQQQHQQPSSLRSDDIEAQNNDDDNDDEVSDSDLSMSDDDDDDDHFWRHKQRNPQSPGRATVSTAGTTANPQDDTHAHNHHHSHRRHLDHDESTNHSSSGGGGRVVRVGRRASTTEAPTRIHGEAWEKIVNETLNKGDSVVKLVFRCKKGSHEKALWLKAFGGIHRLCPTVALERKKTVLENLSFGLIVPQGRIQRSRKTQVETFARDTRMLELVENNPTAAAQMLSERVGTTSSLHTPLKSLLSSDDCGENSDMESDILMTETQRTLSMQSVETSYRSHEELTAQQMLPDVEKMVRSEYIEANKDTEYKVEPAYAYPHRWMTRNELVEEMMLPSKVIHDLRVSNCPAAAAVHQIACDASHISGMSSLDLPQITPKGKAPKPPDKEIGSLTVEVLQCIGLPKLDLTSDTDACVYLVCGSFAFSTDVIQDRLSPMWLRKSRRACDFPIFQAYQRLYVGVFDDDRTGVRDDFAGRVSVDLARLRPHSTYDVTIPLRMSTQIYSREPRGAIRLRFTLRWTSERDALLSYLPRTLNVPNPQHSRPNTETTVMCNDAKAFRNIAITVHGINLPGKFSFHLMKSVIREMTLIQKYMLVYMMKFMKDVEEWRYPTMSAFIFGAWMHCTYANTISFAPAYLALAFFLILVKNYATYVVDASRLRGFVPPTWEELFMALVTRTAAKQAVGGGGGVTSSDLLPGAYNCSVIEPIDFNWNQNFTNMFSGDLEFYLHTREPKGKSVFYALGFLEANQQDGQQQNLSLMSPSYDEKHLEFPWCPEGKYASFSLVECMVRRKNEEEKTKIKTSMAKKLFGGRESIGSDRMGSATLDGEKIDHADNETALHDFDYFDDDDDDDDYEFEFDDNFNELNSSKLSFGRESLLKTASVLRGATNSGRNAIHGSMKRPMKENEIPGFRRRVRSAPSGLGKRIGSTGRMTRTKSGESGSNATDDFWNENTGHQPLPLVLEGGEEASVCLEDVTAAPPGPEIKWPEQNKDVNTKAAKKTTDELAEIKAKTHELTWHAFDDQLFAIKNPDAVYFGEGKKSDKTPKKSRIAKRIDKLMDTETNFNPFVAKISVFVEPMLSAMGSIISLLRAVFNIMTWQDPMFTFWISIVSFALVIILFIFPWRILFFLVGIGAFGPQNWLIRILREKGWLAPKKKRKPKVIEEEVIIGIPDGKPVFTAQHRVQGNELPKQYEIDPREAHHVVIPCSRFKYQRFYDWPPEPLYSKITRAPLNNVQQTQLNNALTRKKVAVKRRRPKHRMEI